MKYSIEFPKITFNHDMISKLELPKFIQQEILTTMTRIGDSTDAGKTASGGALKPYSPKYAEWKLEKTGSRTVNLTVTGELMRSMVVANIDGGLALKFENNHAPSKRTISRDSASKSESGTKGNAKKARSASGAKSAVAATRPKSSSKKGASVSSGGSKRSGGGGGDTPNAVIAEAQYAMGRGGWFTYSEQDIKRIVDRFNVLLGKVLSNLIDIK